MKKNLLTIGLLAIGLSVQAQILMHVDNTAKMYVSDGTLVYNGGGLQTRGSGSIDLYGNMMIVGNNSSDVLKTINADVGSTNKFDGTNIIIRRNTTTNPVRYGQLYITGFIQDNITAIVDKEYANSRHGAYQQIGVPFFNKTFSSLSTDLGGGTTSVFNETRWGGKEILKWSNTYMRFDGSIIPQNPIPNANVAGIAIQLATATTAADRTAYYTVGTPASGGYNPTIQQTVKGRPYADNISPISLVASAVPASFGAGGTNRNIYQERYNTYIGDPFNGVGFGSGSFARNLYQFSNPYLTNLDLTYIGYAEAGNPTDGNNISNILGITVDPQNVTWNNSTGGASAYDEAQKVTFDASSKQPTGNFNTLIIKPLSTFKVKLRDNASQILSFDNLRRFGFVARTTTPSNGNPYSVTAQKNTNAGVIKQLGVIALDADGNQIGETYYVVAPQFTTGFVNDPSISSVQAVTSSMNAIIQTFEEATTGGADPNYSSAYRLYINEANETNYLGKRIDLNLYSQNIASLKFELRDDTLLVPPATHILSGGTGFYYNVGTTGQAVQIKQGDIIPVNNSNFGLYYGTPQTNGSLSTVDTNTKSRTLITYNPDINHHIVRFDPTWKTASVEVFDGSGKLVISEKSVKTNSDYVIKLDSSIRGLYIVRVVGNESSIVNGKILIK